VRIEGRGRDLVLLHGWGFHSGAWDGVAGELASRYRLHRIDLPGHGRSQACEAPGFEQAAEAVARCIPEGSVVAGWSLGGLFAQRIAASSRSRIRAVALVASTPCFVQRDGWGEAMAPATLDAFARDLETNAPDTLEHFVRLNALDGVGARQAVREMLKALETAPMATPSGLRDGLRWLRETDLRGSTPGLVTPCVVLHGARDRIAPVGAGRWLAREIRGARLIELQDAAHLPFATHPRAFIEAVEMADG